MTRGGDGGDWSLRTAICAWYTPTELSSIRTDRSVWCSTLTRTLVSKAGNSGREKGYIASLYSLYSHAV